jgi:hypothetical protein
MLRACVCVVLLVVGCGGSSSGGGGGGGGGGSGGGGGGSRAADGTWSISQNSSSAPFLLVGGFSPAGSTPAYQLPSAGWPAMLDGTSVSQSATADNRTVSSSFQIAITDKVTLTLSASATSGGPDSGYARASLGRAPAACSSASR